MSAVVFLHGFPVNGSAWRPQLEYLKNKTQVYAPDLRGHGNGPQGPGPWFMAHYAEDLKKFLEDKNIQKPVLCALSMGGYVALHFAIQYPELVGGLILCATRVDGDSNEAKDKRFAAVQKLHKEGLAGFAKDFAKSVVTESGVKNNPALLREIEEKILANQARDLAMVLGALASRRDSTPFLAGIKCPALVVAGGEDKVIPPEVTRLMADKIPGARYAEVAGAGHFVNLEQPQRFNELLDKFLN